MSHYNKDGPWVQISGKYISIDHGETPQVFRAATDAELRLMQHAPNLLAVLKEWDVLDRDSFMVTGLLDRTREVISRAEGSEVSNG